jgi:cobalamin biosynthesis protein CobC
VQQANAPEILGSSSGPIEHGGDLDAARRLFPDAPAPWIDLSTGVNPDAYPVGAIRPEAFTRLPSADALRALERTAAAAYGAADARNVMAAPGAQALIQLLPQVIAGLRVGVLGPTYCEHAEAWRRAGREIVKCADVDALATCDIAVIVNPNNPDGRIVARDALAALARSTQLVIDESFADFTPDASFASEAPGFGAVVLRSFGKTYGLAGVRLGFAIGPEPLVGSLRAALGPWAVSGPAIEIGRRALANSAWLASAREQVACSARRLDALLEAAGPQVIGGTTLFRLVESADAQEIWARLGRAGILTRRFAYNPRWLRFGLPARDQWARVESALAPTGAPAR